MNLLRRETKKTLLPICLKEAESVALQLEVQMVHALVPINRRIPQSVSSQDDAGVRKADAGESIVPVYSCCAGCYICRKGMVPKGGLEPPRA
jgi:hypothetical protein